MDIFDEEVLHVWKTLQKHQVIYIMVGGLATNLHGFSRMTADIDVWIKDSLENRKNLRGALEELEIGDIAAIETTQLIPGWTSLPLSSGMELDLMTELAGFKNTDFDECYKLASTATVMEIPIKFLNLTHLINNKKAAGRSKDLIDIIELEKIKNAQS